jgi:hypothetical protein
MEMRARTCRKCMDTETETKESYVSKSLCEEPKPAKKKEEPAKCS